MYLSYLPIVDFLRCHTACAVMSRRCWGGGRGHVMRWRRRRLRLRRSCHLNRACPRISLVPLLGRLASTRRRTARDAEEEGSRGPKADVDAPDGQDDGRVVPEGVVGDPYHQRAHRRRRDVGGLQQALDGAQMRPAKEHCRAYGEGGLSEPLAEGRGACDDKARE